MHTLALCPGPLEAVHLNVALAAQAVYTQLVPVNVLDPALHIGAAHVPRRVWCRQQARVRLVVARRPLAWCWVVLVADSLNMLIQRLRAEALPGALLDVGVNDVRVLAHYSFIER